MSALSHPVADEKNLSRVADTVDVSGSVMESRLEGPLARYGNSPGKLLSTQCHTGNICHHFKTNLTFSNRGVGTCQELKKVRLIL